MKHVKTELASEGFSSVLDQSTETRKRVYLVEYDEQVTEPADAVTAPGVPGMNDDWNPEDPVGIVVVKLEANPVAGSGGMLWGITVDYEDTAMAAGADKKPDAANKTGTAMMRKFDPVEAPIAFEYLADEQDVEFYKDSYNKRATNTTDEPFEPLPSKKTSVKAIIATVNFAPPPLGRGFNHTMYEQWEWTVCGQMAKIDGSLYMPYTLLLGGVSASKQCAFVEETQQWQIYYQTKFKIYYKKYDLAVENNRPWHLKIADYAWSTKSVNGMDRVKIKDRDGKETKRPWPLDGKGSPQPSPFSAAGTVTLEPYPSDERALPGTAKGNPKWSMFLPFLESLI